MDKWEDYHTEKKSHGMKDSTTDEELQGQGHFESFDQGNDELTVKDDDGVIMGWHMKALQNAFIGFTAVLVCAVKIESTYGSTNGIFGSYIETYFTTVTMCSACAGMAFTMVPFVLILLNFVVFELRK